MRGSRDVFVNLPTAYRESLIYQAFSLIFSSLTASPGHVVAVVWPLVNLMEDQVRLLRIIGLSSVSLSDLEEGEAEKEKKVVYSVVFGTLESFLRNKWWREVLSSPIY